MPLTSLQYYLRVFFLLAVCMPALSNAATAEDFAGGDGSSGSPYLIETPAQLNLIRDDLPAHYRLVANIDLGGDDPAGPFYNEGLGWAPIGYQFTGTLDGNHHAIDGLYINRPGQANVGLFAFLLHADVSVKNLILLNAQVTGGDYTGSLSGRFAGAGIIDSIRIVNSTISGTAGSFGTNATGGLIGDALNGTMRRSSAGSAVSCLSEKATPSNLCGAVSVSGEYEVGGLIGNLGGTVSQSYAVAMIQGTYQIGGLVGVNTGHVNTSYALLTGSLSATYNHAGGLVGHNNSSGSSVSDSFSGTLNESFTLAVSTQNGSLVGVNAGTVSASTSFFTATQSNNASLTGSSSSGTVVPIELEPEAQWDYSDDWRTYSVVNSGMPYLAWQSFPFLPTLSEFSGPAAVAEPTIATSITFEDLLALSNAADNGSITAFRVRTLSAGSLTIGGQPYDYANGVRDITASQSAQWTTSDQNYGEITAFLVSVLDDDGLESSTTQALVPVKLTLQPLSYAPLYANPISGIAATKVQTITIDVGAHFTPKHGTTLIYFAQWLPDGFTISEDEGIISGQYAASNDEDVWVYNIQVTAEAVGKNVSTTTGFPLAYFSGGDLSQGEPLLIEHPVQLDALRNFLEPEYKFKLMRHLDMSDKSYQWTSGSGWSGIGTLEAPFQGQLDGNHYTVSYFYTNYSDGDYLGLFGVLGSSGRISNLNLRNVEINGQDHVGALAGLNRGTIESSTVSETYIKGRDNVGGLVGGNSGSLNKTGLVEGTVEGRNHVGGLVGDNTSGQIDSSLTLSFGFDSSVGGVSAVGGLVGENSGTINDSGALMIIGGDADVGTVVGVNTASGVINRTLSAGVILDSGSRTEKGDMLGSNAGTINNSFRFTYADDTVGTPGTVLTEEEFANSATFTNAGWDFETVWEMTTPQNFPFIAPVPRWVLNPNPPRITQIDSPFLTVPPNSTIDTAINAAAIASASDADFFNPTDALFRVVAVNAGLLTINGDPFEAGSNEYIGYYQGELKTFHWQSDEDAAGIVTAFTVVAASNFTLQESSTPVAVEILVNSAPQGSVTLNNTAIVLFPFNLNLNSFFTDTQGDAFTLTVLGSAAGLSVVDGVISGTPEEIGSYLFTVRATDANSATSIDYDFTINVIAPPVPDDTTPPPPPIPNVGDNSNSLNNDLDEIVLPLPGEPLSPEVAAKLADALNKANENIENTAQQIRNGNLSNSDALLSLLSTNKAVGKVGDAAQGNSGSSDAVRSLQGVSGVLNELAGRGNLSAQEKQQVNDIAKASLSNGGKLIRDNSTAEEVESILNATTNVLNNALKTGAPLDEELATTAIQLSLKALNQVLPGFAAALGKNVDLNDPVQVRNLMAEPVVLESALKNSIALRSTESLDDNQVEQNLAGQGINAQAAKRILESLRGAIANPSGISIAGDVNRSATQSLLDALLGAFGSVAAESLSGSGLHLVAATQGLSVEVDPLTGAITVANDTQRYAATSTSVRLVSASVPEGVSYLPDGRAVAIANGMAIELAPAAVDLLGFAAAIERNGFAVNFRNNGSFAFSLEGGGLFSGSFAFDDVGINAQACGEISFTAAQVALNAAEYVFVMQCANGRQQHITPFVHDAGFYTAISQSGLTVRTDRNTGIITIPSVGRFKPSFFVTPLTDIDIELRTEKGDPAVAFSAVPNDKGGTDFDLITASGVQRLYTVP